MQAFIETDTGHAFDILILQTPPQHGKSMTTTESLPAWVLGRWPDRRIILAAYNDEFAEKFLRRNKEKISEFGENLFGMAIGRVNRVDAVEPEGRRGCIIARGLRSGITGNPADLILIDDPIKNREEAYSVAFREKLWNEWQASIKTRLSAGAKVIIIATPWHEDDLMSRIIKQERHVKVICLPVEAGENDLMGRPVGASLCPELGKDDAWLADFKPGYLSDPGGGPAAWAAMYLCRPRTEGGNIVRRGWFRFYDPDDAPAWGTTLISVDAAFKGNEKNDYVAMTVWSKVGGRYYLRHCSNKRLDFPGTLAELRTLRALYPEAWTVLVEDKANGPAIISTLHHEMPGIIGVTPRGGKAARVHAVSSAIESGNVYLPRGAAWVEDYLDQWAGFPTVPHDDMVDSSTQALSYLLFRSGRPSAEPAQSRETEVFADNDALFEAYTGWGS